MTTHYVASRDNEAQVSLQRYAHKLRPRQQAILEFVYAYTQDEYRAPSLREIGLAVGITSTSVANYNIKQLIRWGFLKQTLGTNRSILLTTAGYEVIKKPTPQAIQAEVVRLLLENRYLQERCQRLEARCQALEQMQPISFLR